MPPDNRLREIFQKNRGSQGDENGEISIVADFQRFGFLSGSSSPVYEHDFGDTRKVFEFEMFCPNHLTAETASERGFAPSEQPYAEAVAKAFMELDLPKEIKERYSFEITTFGAVIHLRAKLELPKDSWVNTGMQLLGLLVSGVPNSLETINDQIDRDFNIVAGVLKRMLEKQVEQARQCAEIFNEEPVPQTAITTQPNKSSAWIADLIAEMHGRNKDNLKPSRVKPEIKLW